MGFSLGYQQPLDETNAFVELVADYRDSIDEVYFPWVGQPSGRSVLGRVGSYVDWTGQQRLEDDLRRLRELGVRRSLLLNANCYGDGALSTQLATAIVSLIGHLEDLVGLQSVTTTSPFVAAIVGREFPQIERRASVNMQLGTVPALRPLSGLFDSVYFRKELNRDFQGFAALSEYAHSLGLSVHMLANSGCLHHCPGQIFHDNAVAHEEGISGRVNHPQGDAALCWRYLEQEENWLGLLQSTWVRPEDLEAFVPLVDGIKLASRMHSRPRVVVDAYANGTYAGDLLDLLEPGHTPLLQGHIIANERFPEDWFRVTSSCSQQCHQCTYCREVLTQVLQ